MDYLIAGLCGWIFGLIVALVTVLWLRYRDTQRSREQMEELLEANSSRIEWIVSDIYSAAVRENNNPEQPRDDYIILRAEDSEGVRALMTVLDSNLELFCQMDDLVVEIMQRAHELEVTLSWWRGRGEPGGVTCWVKRPTDSQILRNS